MNRTSWFSLAFLSLTAALFVSLSSAEEDQGQPTENPFAGKVVTVYLDGAAIQNGQVLENAEIKEVGGRTMLVGIGADTGQDGNWTAGVPVGVAWESVAMYYLMTREQFTKMAREHGD